MFNFRNFCDLELAILFIDYYYIKKLLNILENQNKK